MTLLYAVLILVVFNAVLMVYSINKTDGNSRDNILLKKQPK